MGPPGGSEVTWDCAGQVQGSRSSESLSLVEKMQLLFPHRAVTGLLGHSNFPCWELGPGVREKGHQTGHYCQLPRQQERECLFAYYHHIHACTDT